MLWIKSFHIIFVVSWFAGLFYLPRIFVNHAMATDPAEIARLKLMEGKLYRFVTPIGALAIIFGVWLWLGYGFTGGWLHAKTTLVLLLVTILTCAGVTQLVRDHGEITIHVRAADYLAAALQLRDWHARYPSPTPLAMGINLSVRQFARPGLAKHVQAVLEYTGIDAAALVPA